MGLSSITILVANAAVQIHLSLGEFTILTAHKTPQETSVFDANGLKLASLVEVTSHFGKFVG